MKKGMGRILLLCAGIALAGCGNGGEDEDTVQRLSGNASNVSYRGVEYTPYDTTVTEEEIAERLDSFCSSYATLDAITDRTVVQDGDTVNIDYTGYMNGEAFPGGSDTGYNLTIGSGAFIAGFESGLIGAEAGTTVNVDLNFPDPYPNNLDYSGAPVVFVVTVNQIYKSTVPELTDELVAAHTDYATVEEYRQYIRNNLVEQRESYAVNFKQAAVMNKLIDSAVFEGISQEDIDSYYESSASYYSNLASVYETYYGYSFSQFIYYFFGCTTQEEYEALLKDNAEREVKRTLILYAVAEQENFSISEEEFNAAVAEYSVQYNLTDEEFLEQVSRAQVEELVRLEKAAQLIYDTAVAVGS